MKENTIKESFHAKNIKEIFNKFSSNSNGLTNYKVAVSLKKYGPNTIPEKKGKNPVLIFLRQFHSFLIYILIIAAGISYFIDNFIDFYIIIGIIFINATIGFIQEYKAEKSIRALKRMIVKHAKVYRDNELLKIKTSELVPGDVILLEEGDYVPADARIISQKNLRTVESSLTGESVPVEKNEEILPVKTDLGDRLNLVFMGTYVVGGNARAIVIGTGTHTVLGEVAQSIEKIKDTKDHFKTKTDLLAKQMGIFSIIAALLTFLIGYFIRDFEFTQIFLFTIASLVSSIPEGLPAVLTIVLAVGAYRMSKRNVIIRNLSSTETLGVVTTIATDKTGTLTQNTMNVEKIYLPGQSEMNVLGNGYTPLGDFIQDSKKINPLINLHLHKLLNIAGVCNNSKLINDKNKKSGYKIIGDPTEGALIVLSKKSDIKIEEKIDDMPFNSELKLRASMSISLREKETQIYSVGAPENILARSNYIMFNGRPRKMTPKDKKEIIKQILNFSKDAMRVIALSYKKSNIDNETLNEHALKDLIFVGIVGILDPPREEVKDAVLRARKAGIRIIMQTGDHLETAIAVGKKIGLITGEESNKYPIAMIEQDLLKLNNKEFREVIKNVSIFARMTPLMKLKIVETLQKMGEVVAMTGDGVNDAPALKKADIGISMGKIGTDVARENSSMILADDNFASIINAIEEGRIVFINTRQSSSYLITTNFAEVVTILTSLVISFPLPLLPTQLLWLNLVTDGVNNLALAVEPNHHDVLNEPPRNKDENILSKEIIPFLIIMTVIMVILTLGIFSYYVSEDLTKARTAAFTVMAFTQIFNLPNMRSRRRSVFKIGFFSNKYVTYAFGISIILSIVVIYLPFFQNLLHFSSLKALEVLIIIILSSSVLWCGELYKKIRYHL